MAIYKLYYLSTNLFRFLQSLLTLLANEIKLNRQLFYN